MTTGAIMFAVLLVAHLAVLALPPARLPRWFYIEAPLINLSVLPAAWAPEASNDETTPAPTTHQKRRKRPNAHTIAL